MLKNDKVKFIIEKLDEFYPTVEPPLNHSSNFTLLIAVLLSANSTDKSVNKVTPNLFKIANTPKKMLQLSYEDLYQIIKPCGLGPAKASNILKLSKMIIESHKGKVPKNFEELEQLPGVGHKTASVVISQGFGIPAFPVDTHIHRLADRWGLSNGTNVVKTERDLKKVFSKDTWNRRHLQIIYFGREYCPARNHDLSGCPICSWASTKKRIRQGR